jgi:hypothetical protein
MNRGAKLEAQFNEFDAANSQFWEAWENRCQIAIRQGYTTYGAQSIMEVTRWDWDMTTTRTDEFKINNNFAAFYARKWLVKHPEHPDFFKLRTSYADDSYWGRELRRRQGPPPNGDGQGELF